MDIMLNTTAWNDDGSCSSLSLSSLNSTTALSMEPTSSSSSSSSSSASSSSPATTTTTTATATTTTSVTTSSGMKMMAKSLSLFPTCDEEEETELRLGLGPPVEAANSTTANANTNGNSSEKQAELMTISLAAVDEAKNGKAVQDLNLFGHQYCSNKTQYTVDRPVAASILPTKRSYNDALGPGVMFQGDPNKALHASMRPPRAPNSSMVPPSPFIISHPDSAALLKDLPLPKPSEAGSSLSKAENTNTSTASRPVVGWPPVRSFRRNTIATNQIKPSIAETETKQQQQQQKQATGSDCSEQESSLFVKANVDGVPIGRKVDLKSYDGYDSLKLALGDMFQRSIHGSEHVLTYEDKDGDWMLVGDVPWDLFLMSVRRLRIMKSSDDIGHGGRSSSKAVG